MGSQEKILSVVTEERYYSAYEIKQKTGLSSNTVYKHLKLLVLSKRLGCVNIGIRDVHYKYFPIWHNPSKF